MTQFTSIRTILFVLCLMSLRQSYAQETNYEKAPMRWSFRFQTGLNSFQTTGIPQSRHQINQTMINQPNQQVYRQESRTAGLVYEFGVRYAIFKKGEVGLLLNIFRDDDEYFTTLNEPQNVVLIKSDTALRNTLKNLQSYLNLGITYDHLIYSSPSGRHSFKAGAASGISINRTPDRTEYDAFDVNNFIAQDTVGGHVWHLSHTHFKNGFFIAPSIHYSLLLKKEMRFNISVSEFFQWHSTAKSLKILAENSSGYTDTQAYTLRAFQLKFGLEF